MNYESLDTVRSVLPYVNRFKGKTFVIKYGGSILKNKEQEKSFIEDIKFLKQAGINIVIVHGGGPNISNYLSKLNIENEFINGLRVTSREAMEVVEMVLSGNVCKDIVHSLCNYGLKAIGLNGKDNLLIEAKKKCLEIDGKNIDIGFVGYIDKINKEILDDLIDKDYIPVISPIGCDSLGSSYNINGDYVAASIASSLESEKLILITDVQGIYKDIHDKNSIISSLTIEEIEEYISDGIITGGMIPKMECTTYAIKNNTKNVHLIDGNVEHSLLLEIFTPQGIGTMIQGGE